MENFQIKDQKQLSQLEILAIKQAGWSKVILLQNRFGNPDIEDTIKLHTLIHPEIPLYKISQKASEIEALKLKRQDIILKAIVYYSSPVELNKNLEIIQLNAEIAKKEKELELLKEEFEQLKLDLSWKYDVSHMRRLAHIGLRGQNLPSQVEIEEGMDLYEHTSFRANAANAFMTQIQTTPSSEFAQVVSHDVEGLKRIQKHRKILADYSLQIFPIEINEKLPPTDSNNVLNEKELQTLIQKIQANIQDLDDPDSDHVVKLADGTTSFSLPGMWFSPGPHAICYEFKKIPTPQGDQYRFVIHNRGGQSEDEALDDKLHGPFLKLEGSNQRVAKTIVEIQVSKEALMDPALLENLLRTTKNLRRNADQTKWLAHPYKVIDDVLVNKHKGQILQTKQDVLFRQISKKYPKELIPEQEMEMQNLVKGLMETDTHYQPVQRWGTCADSSLTTPEQDMASSATKKALKLFTMQLQTERATKERMHQPTTTADDKILALSQKKMEQMKQKLSTPKPKPPSQDVLDELAKKLNLGQAAK